MKDFMIEKCIIYDKTIENMDELFNNCLEENYIIARNTYFYYPYRDIYETEMREKKSRTLAMIHKKLDEIVIRLGYENKIDLISNEISYKDKMGFRRYSIHKATWKDLKLYKNNIKKMINLEYKKLIQ